MTSNNEQKQFEIGKPVFVWKTTGVKDSQNGPTTSERLDQGFPNVEVTEPLMVKEKFGSNKALCVRGREDRKGQPDEQIIVHRNHINDKSPYYANRGAKGEQKKALSPAEKLQQVRAEAEAAAAALAKAQAEVAESQEQTITEGDRDEAAALFANSN